MGLPEYNEDSILKAVELLASASLSEEKPWMRSTYKWCMLELLAPREDGAHSVVNRFRSLLIHYYRNGDMERSQTFYDIIKTLEPDYQPDKYKALENSDET